MRKNPLTRQVRRAYRQAELARICTLREDRFGRAFGMQTVNIPTGRKSPSLWSSSGRPEDYYHFRDNGGSVLAVAHLDTVVSQKGRTPRFRATERGPLIQSGALDDRLGAYVILHLLPKLGVTCDWLLTVGEESGQSTAEHFDPAGKKYDWAIEFDRGGTDVVMYQYEDRASRRLVEAAGARMGHGSYSDIAYLDHLDVKAFNWGVGYRGNYHSEAGYAYLDDTFAMVAQYLRFHGQNAGTRLPHEPYAWDDRYGRRYGDDYYGDCFVCMARECVDSVTGYCEDCGSCQDCGLKEDDGCMCYVPRHVREEAAGAGSGAVSVTTAGQERDWREMTWGEYCQLRPEKSDFDDVLCAECSRHIARCECDHADDPDSQPVKVPADAECWDCGKDLDGCTCAEDDAEADETALDEAHRDAQRIDGPGTLISAAPPWSEHRPEIPTGRKTRTSQIRAGEAGADLGQAGRNLREDLMTAVAASRKADGALSEADLGWHETTRKTADSGYILGHRPGQAWASAGCLRCAARWPHPVSGSAGIHPEADCPGCERCTGATRIATGAIHVIPAHLAGESDACTRCRAYAATARVLSDIGRSGTPQQEAVPGLVSQDAADRYLTEDDG